MNKKNQDNNKNSIPFISLIPPKYLKSDSEPNKETVIDYSPEMKTIVSTLLTSNKLIVLTNDTWRQERMIVEQLKDFIKSNEVAKSLIDKVIIELNMENLVKDIKNPQDLKEKLDTGLKKLEQNGNIILFIEKLHTFFDSSSYYNPNFDLSGIIKKLLNQQQIKIIGTTINYQYNKMISHNLELSWVFERIKMFEDKYGIIIRRLNKNPQNSSHVANVKFDYSLLNIREIIDSINKIACDNKIREYIGGNYSLTGCILDDSFNYAFNNGHDKVEISDIAESIGKCNILIPKIREELALDFFNQFNQTKEKRLCKIYRLPNKL